MINVKHKNYLNFKRNIIAYATKIDLSCTDFDRRFCVQVLDRYIEHIFLSTTILDVSAYLDLLQIIHSKD